MSDMQKWWCTDEVDLEPGARARREEVLSMDYAELLCRAAYAKHEAAGKVPIKGFYTCPEDILEEGEVMRGLACAMSPEGRSQVVVPPRQNCPECGAPAKEWHPLFSPEPEGWMPDGRGFFVCTTGHHHAWFYDGRGAGETREP